MKILAFLMMLTAAFCLAGCSAAEGCIPWIFPSRRMCGAGSRTGPSVISSIFSMKKISTCVFMRSRLHLKREIFYLVCPPYTGFLNDWSKPVLFYLSKTRNVRFSTSSVVPITNRIITILYAENAGVSGKYQFVPLVLSSIILKHN